MVSLGMVLVIQSSGAITLLSLYLQDVSPKASRCNTLRLTSIFGVRLGIAQCHFSSLVIGKGQMATASASTFVRLLVLSSMVLQMSV